MTTSATCSKRFRLAIVPNRSDAASGTVSTFWTLPAKNPKPASSVPQTRTAGYPTAIANSQAPAMPASVSTMRRPRIERSRARCSSDGRTEYPWTPTVVSPPSVSARAAAMSEKTARTRP